MLGWTLHALCLHSALAAGAWDRLEEQLLGLQYLAPFNLLVGDETGVLANVTIGAWSSSKKVVPIFSASKLASAAVFYNLDADVLPLDTKVSDHLSWWTSGDEGKGRVTIRHLLNFTSGFTENGCHFIPDTTYEDCAKLTYEENYVEENFGIADYNEAHLQIAVAVALKVTSAASWNELWYDRVGQPSGLADDTHWVFPSAQHPGGGAGLGMSTDNYSKFLSAFSKSLHSNARPTEPLKIGGGIDYGAAFWGPGMAMTENSKTINDETYAYTSWRPRQTQRSARGDPDLVHSVGCRGWLPGVFPATEDGPGWWMQLSREGGFGWCIGDAMSRAAVEGYMGAEGLVDTIVEAVKEHRQASEMHLEVVHADVQCKREEMAEWLCNCEEDDLMKCGFEAACMQGVLSCDPDMWQGLLTLCSQCVETEKCHKLPVTTLEAIEEKGFRVVKCHEK